MVGMRIGPGTADVVGRRTELDLLGGVLSNLDRGSGVTIRLRGDAGIGKTTLLDWVAAQTTAAVIRLTGSESDAQLAYSGLASLMKSMQASARRGARTTRPGARRRRRARIDARQVDGRRRDTRGTRCGERDTPLLLLIDDAQWVDEASCSALAFALRRLPDEPVVAIVAERAAWDRSPSTTQVSRPSSSRVSMSTMPLRCWGPTRIAPSPNAVSRPPTAARWRSARSSGYSITISGPVVAPLPDDLTGRQPPDSLVRRPHRCPRRGRQASGGRRCGGARHDRRRHPRGRQPIRRGNADLAAGEVAGIIRSSPESIELMHPLMRTAIRDAVGPGAMREAHAALA